MNKIVYILSLLLLLLVSCKEEEVVVQGEDTNVASVTIPNFIVDGPTRTSLVYNYLTTGMDFYWNSGDAVGIFAMKEYTESGVETVESGKYTPYKFVTTEQLIPDKDGRKTFEITNEDYRLTDNYSFTAYYMYDNDKIADDKGFIPYTRYPISYRNQRQESNVDMGFYYGSGANAQKYTESEAAASSHLKDFDYMLSTEKRPNARGGVIFPFEHLASIVRFFLRTPSTTKGKYRFNKIRVVAPKRIFYVDALVDMSNCSEEPIEATRHLKMVGEPQSMIELSLGTNESSYFEMDYPTKNYSRYFVAYMMFNPVDLGTVLDDDDKMYLYLEGVKVENDGNGGELLTPAYFRTNAPLDHKNLKAGYLYQWSDLGIVDPEDPIELQAISVEEWKDEVLDNTENGNGTHAW